MYGASHKLLAGSALSQNQNRVIVLADFLDHFIDALHFRRNADHLAVARTSAQLFAQDAVLVIEFFFVDQALELGAQLVDMERLGDVITGAETCGFDSRLDCAVLREHQDRDLGILLADAAQELHSAIFGHAQIGDGQVDGKLLEFAQRFIRRSGRADAQPGFDCDVAAKAKGGLLVVYNENSRRALALPRQRSWRIRIRLLASDSVKCCVTSQIWYLGLFREQESSQFGK